MKSDFITGSAGFTAENFDQKAPTNALILDSEQLWFNENGELEVCGGTKRADTSIAGDIAFLFGDGYGTIGDGDGTGAGNAAKYIGNVALFVTNADITIYDPSLDATPFTIPFAGATGTPPLISTSSLEEGIAYIAPWNPTLGEYQAPVPLGVLPQEEAPELIQPLTLGTNFRGLNNGTYALRATYLRTDTGGESLASPTSNTLAVVNSSLLARFPLPTNPRYTRNSPLSWDTNDIWRIYATPVNFANTTVFNFLKEIAERRLATENYTNFTASASGGVTTITLTAEQLSYLFTKSEIEDNLIGKTVTAGSDTGVITEVVSLTQFKVGATFVATSGSSLTITSSVSGFSEERILELEWTENDLSGEIPPFNFYPPFTSEQFFGGEFENLCKFVVPLNNVVLLIGTDGGNGIRVSVPNFIEAFPPDFTLNLPETPIGVSYRAEDGFCYVICKNSIHEIRWTGAVQGAPVVLRTISTNIGAASQKSFFVMNGNIYMFTSNNRVVRVSPDGAYDYSFGNPVTPYVKNWTPGSVTVAHDERRNAMVFFHEQEFLAFHLDLNAWSSPVKFTRFTPGTDIPDGDIRTAITYRGVIHLFDETTSETYLLDRDLGGTQAANAASAVAKFQWNSFGNELYGKTIRQVQLMGESLDAATTTLKCYADRRASQMGTTRTFSFSAGESISKVLDTNEGIGRLISLKVEISSTTRGVLHFLRVGFQTTKIIGNY